LGEVGVVGEAMKELKKSIKRGKKKLRVCGRSSARVNENVVVKARDILRKKGKT